MDELDRLLPRDIEITYDRAKMPVADAVVFNLPFLHRDLEGDLEKPDGQVWVAWSYESEANYPWMLSDGLKEVFDLWMTYHLDADIVLPYYDYTFREKLLTPPCGKDGDVCMFVSSPVNHSHRLEYLSELTRFLPIDSYGRWRRNSFLKEDTGYASKLETIKRYRFTIAFENATSPDYVTEKFFEPLVMGSVPIYLGAPNVRTFAPGPRSFIDARAYESPEALAAGIRKYCRDEAAYAELLEWKKAPLRPGLSKLIEDQEVHAFHRLAREIERLKNKRDNNHEEIELSQVL
jgi:hypothetical protein